MSILLATVVTESVNVQQLFHIRSLQETYQHPINLSRIIAAVCAVIYQYLAIGQP